MSEIRHECGCVDTEVEIDVDRPFMCYTDWKTFVRRCPEHQEEFERKERQENERREQDKLKREEAIEAYLQTVRDTAHTEFVPIQYAIDRFRHSMKNVNSKSWIQDYLRRTFNDVLMFQQKRPRCRIYCCKSKVDAIDFKHIWNLQNTQYRTTRG